MHKAISLISDRSGTLERIGAPFSNCGLTLWTAASAEAYAADTRSAQTLCLVIDMQDGLRCLQALLESRIRCPVILITDDAVRHSSPRFMNADVLDILARPVDLRVLLGWIECICVAHLVLKHRNLQATPQRQLAA